MILKHKPKRFSKIRRIGRIGGLIWPKAATRRDRGVSSSAF
jgi:hypothetical protein